MPETPLDRPDDSPAAAFARAAALAGGSDPQAAVAAFQDLVGRWPELALGWANLGVMLRRTGRAVDAVAAFARAARLAPSDPQRHEALASAAYDAADMRRAAAAIKCWIVLAPAEPDGCYNLALVLPLIGPRERGLAWMQRTACLAPGRARVWDRVARIAHAHGADAVAERGLRRAACLEPGHIDTLTDLAKRHLDGVTFARLFCADPSDDVVRVDLAEALWNDGQGAAARDLLAPLADRAEVRDRAIRLARMVGQDRVAARTTRYEDWIAAYEHPLDAATEVPGEGPVISVILPVHNPPREVLGEAIQSVLTQSYPHWELCICDDASSEADVIDLLDHAAAADPRIMLVRRRESGHISTASNDALALATGEFVTFLDHDDRLTPDALAQVVRALAERDADILYTDEDKIDLAGQRFDPFFKPGWDPDRMMYQNVVTHLAVYRRALVERVGGLRVGLEGSQDHDLVLRVSEVTTADRIRHIPHILYHWRTVAGSTSVSIAAKPYAVAAARRAVAEHIARQGLPARIETHPFGHRVVFDLPDPAPTVGVVIATRDQPALLRRCLDGLLEATDYPALSVAVLDNGSTDPAALAYLEEAGADARVTVWREPGPFNFSALMNAGARRVAGEVLLFLNDDVEVLHGDWLRELVSQAVRPDVGPVGARLLYPSMKVQHAGVILVEGHGGRHLDVGYPDRDPGYRARARVVQTLSAVTGACIAIRRTVFERIGGFDAETLAIDFSDIDFCLRASAAGYRTVWTPFARLLHHESASRGGHLSTDKRARFEAEQALFVARWGGVLGRDPYYNVNLATAPGTKPFELAFPPRR